jgi:hypothetical protein
MLWHVVDAKVKNKSSPRRLSDTAWESCPALFRQTPALCGHLRHYTTLCGEASVNSVTLWHPPRYDRCAAPSKEDGRTLKKDRGTCPTPTQDYA